MFLTFNGSSPTRSMPPPKTSALSQPDSIIVDGPRKCCPPAYFAENGDPLVTRKKAKQVTVEPTKAKSVSTEEAREEVSGTPQPLHHPLLIPVDQNLCGNSDTHSHSTTPESTDLKPNGTQSDLDKEEDKA